MPLGFANANPNEWSQAHGVSGNGDLVVGNNNTGASVTDIKALLWDAAHGMRYLTTALTDDYALTLPPGWKITGGWDVSDNGGIIGVAGYDPSNIPAAGIITIIPEPIPPLSLLAFTTLLCRHRRNPRPRGQM